MPSYICYQQDGRNFFRFPKSLENTACHSAGLKHVEKPTAGYGSTGEENCRSCHTEDFNPDFDYEELWKPIAH